MLKKNIYKEIYAASKNGEKIWGVPGELVFEILGTLSLAKSTTATSTGSVNNFTLGFCSLEISFQTL